VSELVLEALRGDRFQLEPAVVGDGLTVRFSGTGDMDATDQLSEYLPRVHTELVRLELVNVTFDFHDLLFMNSSCFKSFVTFIDNAKATQPGYRIRFLTEPKHHWQRRSLEALRRLAMGLVTIVPTPSSPPWPTHALQQQPPPTPPPPLHWVAAPLRQLTLQAPTSEQDTSQEPAQ
jgi:hypothetical protein